ncbi:MAG: alpha-amylase family glycosyl hydrolase [Bacteroidaceae bacterium]|nr:alpha-amylase family glycosyl hydrolase [Bacteroidaceae bacterium]
MEKITIYQVFTRLFGANSKKCVNNGLKDTNGCGKMADFTLAALGEIKKLGATHIWYTGIIEHATKTDYTQYGIQKDHPAVVKGNAGSPYAIKDYYDIDPDLATKVPERMKEFENLVKRTHKAELKMIIDFVPNHVARQYHSDAKPEGVRDLGEDDDTTMSFSLQNNFYYIPYSRFSPNFSLKDEEMGEYVEEPAKVTGNDCFTQWAGQNDWYETVKLNYGVDYQGTHQLVFSPSTPDTWIKMRDILLFWASKGIDGFRCDMAEMVPCDFWGWAIPQVKEKYPDIIFIAEVYNPHEYRNYIHRGHFDYLYDKVGLYDTLRSVVGGNSASCITGAWQAVDDIKDHMLNFLENHDEQRIASPFFAGSAEKGKPALLVSALMGTNPMMVYFGQELGEPGMDEEGFSGRDGRTTIFDYWTIDTIRRWRNGGKFEGKLLTDDEKKLQHYYEKVLGMCNKDKAIREGKFYDIQYANYDNELMDTNKLYAFIRKADKELILVVANFSDEDQRAWVKIPAHAFEYLGIPTFAEKVECKELLSHTIEKHIIMPDGTTYIEVPSNGGKALKFKL